MIEKVVEIEITNKNITIVIFLPLIWEKDPAIKAPKAIQKTKEDEIKQPINVLNS